MWILISWLHQKPADLDLQCFQKKEIRFQQDKGKNEAKLTPVSPVAFSPSEVVQYSVPHMCVRRDSMPVSVALNVAP